MDPGLRRDDKEKGMTGFFPAGGNPAGFACASGEYPTPQKNVQ